VWRTRSLRHYRLIRKRFVAHVEAIPTCRITASGVLAAPGSRFRGNDGSTFKAGLAGIFARTRSLAVGEIKGQEPRRERAVGGGLVAGWIVGADAGRDAGDLGVVVRAEKERDRVA